ncbi:predicted protein [Plenodomus lingam JN3]|uniref:Predicted protein n=1 Tax=Leptosphaeria maculans (strain JN3 / isolate v23.1.3 / race Av1-4-5-6-7-8) TaxID=985895 RepID=E5A1X2_LEPMJ|nr:predicted protein [Plenodomus lingam JN3]CBX97689.1 predicted protein [Plenodomus lingam JN3]
MRGQRECRGEWGSNFIATKKKKRGGIVQFSSLHIKAVIRRFLI